MKFKEKRKLIDEINEAFIEILAREQNKRYAKYVRDINKELLANVENLSASKVKSIVESKSINIEDSSFLFMILSAITLILENQRLTKEQKLPLLPIIAVLGIYSITRPKQFVEKIYHINKGIGLNANEKKAKIALDTYKAHNAKALKKINTATQKSMTISQRKAATNTGRKMIKDLKIMRKQNISIKDMESQLSKKYTRVQVESMINTELHSQAELAKGIHARDNGFTHKTWKTQGDSRVRQTRWHNAVSNKRIPIDNEFKAAGLHAMQPGDESLPPKERIRCRCYLIYD